eukprot:scaffold30350_cov105-Isochrysis_galbana.AAC.5
MLLLPPPGIELGLGLGSSGAGGSPDVGPPPVSAPVVVLLYEGGLLVSYNLTGALLSNAHEVRGAPPRAPK